MTSASKEIQVRPVPSLLPVGSLTQTSFSEALDQLVRGPRPGGHIHFVNAYSIVVAHDDPAFAEALGDGTCLVDGLPVVWAMTRLDPAWSSENRVPGPDLFSATLDAGRAADLRHFLLGGSEETLRLLREAIAQQYPGVRVVGAESPPFASVDQVNWSYYLDLIRASGAHLVWVGLGTPKQDFVSRLMSERDPDRTYLAVGAAFDFVAGTVRRAPKWMRRLGLEWLYRLGSEPRRLWRRYLVGNSRFLGIAVRAARAVRARP